MLSQTRSSAIPSLQKFLLGNPLSILGARTLWVSFSRKLGYILGLSHPHPSRHPAFHASVKTVPHTVLSSLQKPSPKTSHFPPSPGLWLLLVKPLSDLPPLFLRSSSSGHSSTFLWDSSCKCLLLRSLQGFLLFSLKVQFLHADTLAPRPHVFPGFLPLIFCLRNLCPCRCLSTFVNALPFHCLQCLLLSFPH